MHFASAIHADPFSGNREESINKFLFHSLRHHSHKSFPYHGEKTGQRHEGITRSVIRPFIRCWVGQVEGTCEGETFEVNVSAGRDCRVHWTAAYHAKFSFNFSQLLFDKLFLLAKALRWTSEQCTCACHKKKLARLKNFPQLTRCV